MSCTQINSSFDETTKNERVFMVKYILIFLFGINVQIQNKGNKIESRTYRATSEIQFSTA